MRIRSRRDCELGLFRVIQFASVTTAIVVGLAIIAPGSYAACGPAGPYGAGNDFVFCSPGAGENLDTLGGNDTIVVTGGTVTTANQGTGGDFIFVQGGTVGSIDQGSGADWAEISFGTVTGVVQQGAGVDTFVMSGGTIGSLDQGSEFDFAEISGGRIVGQFTDGDDVTFTGGRIGSVNLVVANNIFRMSGNAVVDTFVNAEQHNDRFELMGGTIGTFVNTGNGDDVVILGGTVVGTHILFEGGNDTLVLTSGSVGGDILMGPGSDTATVNASFPTGLPGGTLDGGDDTSIADGDIDTLTFAGWSGVLRGAAIVNWERIIVDGGFLSFSDTTLVTGQDIDPTTFMPTSGLTLSNGATMDFGSQFTVTGNVTTQAGTTIIAGTAGGVGAYAIAGQFVNSGHLSFSGSSPATGDRLTVTGDYFGGGSLRFDVALDATEASDMMIVQGSVRAPGTVVTINDVGSGIGAPTGSGPGNGIKIIDVSNTGNTATGDFVLSGHVAAGAISGAYVYNLFLESDGNWYLQNVYVADPTVSGPARPSIPLVPLLAPTVAIYEAYPQLLHSLMSLPTLQQRIGGASTTAMASPCGGIEQDEEVVSGRPHPCDERDLGRDRQVGWARISGARSWIGHADSTTKTRYTSHVWQLESGMDVFTHGAPGGVGRFAAGVTVHQGRGEADARSPLGNGSVDATGTGFGLTATYTTPDGLYVDGQARATWFDTDIAVDGLGNSATDRRATGYALGLEVGRRYGLTRTVSLTPQAQLVFASLDGSEFTDAFNARVSIADGESLLLRGGLSIDVERTRLEADGTRSRHKLYGIANLYYEFLDGTEVSVSGVAARFEPHQLWGELGLGGVVEWDDGNYAVYGEVAHKVSLEDFYDGRIATGKLGLKIRF